MDMSPLCISTGVLKNDAFKKKMQLDVGSEPTL